jgi:hypothetical protein
MALMTTIEWEKELSWTEGYESVMVTEEIEYNETEEK